MLCQNCGKNEVTFHYTQVINGVKKEMALCDECAKSLGLESLDFNMPINFSSFLGDFLNLASQSDLLPSFIQKGTLTCDKCNMTYDEFVETGKFGCSNCYDIFADTLEPVLKNIHGSTNHIGRRSRLTKAEKQKVSEDVKKAQKNNVKEPKENSSKNKAQQERKQKIDKLNADLKQAIKEERYEDAAKIRDEINGQK